MNRGAMNRKYDAIARTITSGANIARVEGVCLNERGTASMLLHP